MAHERSDSGSGPGQNGAAATCALGGGSGDPLRDAINLCERLRTHFGTFVEGFRSARQADRARRAFLIERLAEEEEAAIELLREHAPLLRAMAVEEMRGAKHGSQPGRKRT